MKKSKRLLSVLLAMLLILSSMSVMASAAKISYQTVEDLGENGLNAYSPYGAVTRLNTEERLSILFDYLDGILATIPNATMSAPVIGNIKYGSVNEILQTIDSVTSNGAIKTAINIATSSNTLSYIKFDSWQPGMSREGTPHETIVYELLELISANAPAVEKIIKDGALNLGLIGTILKNFVDLNSVNKMVAELPLLVKGSIFPLFERWDDSQALISTYSNTAGSMESVLNGFVQRLFTNDMSITSYKEDAAGNCISNHTLPTVGVLDDATNGTRHYFEKGTDEQGKYILRYAYDTKTGKYEAIDATTRLPNKYYKTEELDAEGNGTGEFVFVKTNADGTEENLKYYKNDSQFLPSFAADLASGTKTLDLTTQKPAELLYMFIPYVFAEMAPVVLNGSVKQLLAKWFGASFTEVGAVTSEAVKAVPGYDATLPIFAAEHGDYLWEWSDYAVLSNGTHVWRFEDSIYVADTTNANPYFDIIDWNYKVPDDFMNEFIPGADGNTPSAAGYTTLLQGLNDFLIKVANLVLDKDLVAKMALTNGDNSNLIENVKKAAQTVVAISPESIFGSNYNDPDKYYSLMMSNNNQEVLLGIACTVIDLLMPQMILPTADKLAGKGYTVAAVLAAVVREIATQLVPNINYDALIYADYNTKTFLTGKDNSYWLDVALTIGTDIGFKYLTALADMGEDQAAFAGANWTESKTYTASDMDAVVGKDGAVKLWEQRVDYIIDWALTTGAEYGWKFDRLVNCGATVDLATVQDPWVKLGNIFKSILPIKDVFNIDTTSETWLETLLRDDFVLALLDLDVTKIVGGATANGVLNIPTKSILRTTNTMSAVVVVIRNLLNNLLYKVAGNANLIDPAKITGIDSLLGSDTTNDRKNMATVVRSLLEKLFVAYGNGLLDPVMPILGFFVGWKTDPQEFDPPYISVNTSFTANNATVDYGYLYAQGGSVSNSIMIKNDASGMLLKHRNSNVVDSANTITVSKVTIDGAEVDLSSVSTTIAPGGKINIPFTVPYSGNEAALEVAVSYTVIGKDGNPLGGTMTATSFVFISDRAPEVHTTTYADLNKAVSGGINNGKWLIGVQPQSTTTVYVANDMDEANAIIRSMGFSFKDVSESTFAIWVQSASAAGTPNFVNVDTTSYVHGTSEKTALSGETPPVGFANADNDTCTIQPFSINDAVDTKDLDKTGTVIDLGTFSVTWMNKKKANKYLINSFDDKGDNRVTAEMNAGDIYIVDRSELQSTYSTYLNMDLQKVNFANADTEWAAYIAAMKAANVLLNTPFYLEDFNNGVYSADKIQAATDALKTAYENLTAKAVISTTETLENALATAEPGGNVPEINYQDYSLYEYFNYQDERTAVRNRLNEYEAPVAPENYIAGSALSASEINALVEAEHNPQKKLALNATVTEPSAKEIAAYNEAVAAWKAPAYTELDNANQAMLLNYYKRFLIANTTNKQFLAKEIDTANAQAYVEADYSADSWAAYQAALATAVAVNSKENALQSEVFDAKHALMKAQNELLLKSKSAKETGALADLATLAAIAESIFANPGDYTVVGDMTEADAYAALIKALGYKYTDADGNEVVLYNRSAYEFLKYDRENTTSNLKKIDAAKQALVDAIANFKSTVEIIASEITTGGVVDTVNQYVYGVNPGDVAANYFEASNGGTLTWKVGHASSENGTGAQAIVTNKNGEPVAIYTLVIFGDVNGDGAIDAFDASLINMNMTGASALADEFAVAGDVVGENDDIGLADYSAVVNYAIGAGSIAQTRH